MKKSSIVQESWKNDLEYEQTLMHFDP